MNTEKIKTSILAVWGTLRSVLKYVISTLRSVFKYMISKERAKARELTIFAILQYIFLPILCGFLTAGILAMGVLEKLGLDRFGFANFPTIKIQTTVSSTYSGLMLVAGLGCILGLIFSRILRFGAKLGHFDFISPPKSLDNLPVPSVSGFIKSIICLVGIPVIIILGAVTSLELAKTGILPMVHVDAKYQSFEVTLSGLVIVAALGCLLMFLYDMILTVLLRMTKRKEVEIKELG